MSQEHQPQGHLQIAAPKPVYSALHHRSFVLQDVRVEGELALASEPREPEPSGEPSQSSSFSTEKQSGSTPVIVFHQNQQPPGSFQQQLLVSHHRQVLPEMIQSRPPPSPPSRPRSAISSRTHNSAATSTSFAKSRIGSKTPPALFNPTSMGSSSTATTTRQGQIKSPPLDYLGPSPPLSGGRPLPAVPLVSQDSTSSSQLDVSLPPASIIRSTGSDTSPLPRSSASLGSSTSTTSPHTHLLPSTTSIRTKTPPSLINTASGSSTVFPMSSDIMAFDGDSASNANNRGRGNARKTVHETQAQETQGVTYSYTSSQNQNQSASSSSSSAFFGSATLSPPALASSPPPLLPPPPPLPAMVAMTPSPVSGPIPSASVGASAIISTTTKSNATSMESAGNWSISRDGRGNNSNSSTAVTNSISSNINSSNNSGSSTTANTALVRPLPLPPGSTPRTRTRSSNASNVLSGPSGSHASSVNVLSMPISWASRPVDLNRSVPASSTVSTSHACYSGGEQHQQQQLQSGQQIQQGPGQQYKTYSRPPSRPSLRSSRPSSPSAPSSPPQPPSNLAFGLGPSTTSSVSAGAGANVGIAGFNTGAGGSSSPPPRSKTITSTTRSTARGGRLRSRSASRPKTQVPAGRYESFLGASAAMGTGAAATAMTSTAPPNTAPPQARLAPQGSRTIPPARKRSATATSLASESLGGPSSVTITKSRPLGSGLSALTTTTTTISQPIARQASRRSVILPQRSPPPQSQLPSPPSLVSHHHSTSLGHVPSSGPIPGHNASLPTPISNPAPSSHTTTLSSQRSGSSNKRHQGCVQLSRQLVSRAAAVPAPLNPNYNYVGVAKGGVYYVRDKDSYPYQQRRQDEQGKGSETGTGTGTMTMSSSSVSKKVFPVRPLPKPAVVQPLLSDKQLAEENVAGINADAEDGRKPTIDDNDDDGISCLSYIDSPDSAVGVHPDLGSLSFAGDDDMVLSDDGDGGGEAREPEDPLLVYIDDNFDSSEEDEEFARSVSPMRYARPGSDGTVDSGDDVDGSDTSSDFFSDVDDPFKYNKGRSKRRGRTRTMVPVGLVGVGGSSNESAGVGARGSQSQKGAKGKLGIRMSGSLGSMRDLIEGKATRIEKEKRKKEADAGDAGGVGVGGAIVARTKSAERDRTLPQRYGHPQESPLPPPPSRLWFAPTEANRSKVSLHENVAGGGDKLISPVSLSSSQGGRSLSPMRYAKRMSVELLDDSSSLGSPISPVGVGGLLKGKHAKVAGGSKKGRKKRPQPWSYQFDYQAAKASSPFTFGMGGEKAATAAEEKELLKKEEEKKKVEEVKKREKAKSLKAFKTKEGSEGRKKLSIDVLDISLLRRASHPTLLEPGTANASADDVFGLGSGGSGGSGKQTLRTWDDSPASSATASSFTMVAAAEGPGNNPVIITPPPHSSSHPPAIVTTTPPPVVSTGVMGRTRTFKVRNP